MTSAASQGRLSIEIASPDEIKGRALSRQSSQLTSSLAKLPQESLLSSPGAQATNTPPIADHRASSFEAARDEQAHWYQDRTSRESTRTTSFIGSFGHTEAGEGQDYSRPASMKVPVPKLKRQDTGQKSDLAASLDDEEREEGMEFVPPHILSLPKYSSAMPADPASKPGSLYEGRGRKLRGMDAVRFRRNVMRQTGFLEGTSEHSIC